MRKSENTGQKRITDFIVSNEQTKQVDNFIWILVQKL